MDREHRGKRILENRDRGCKVSLRRVDAGWRRGARRARGCPWLEPHGSNVPKPFVFRQKTRMGQIKKGLDVGHRFTRCQGVIEDGGVRSDSQITHHSRPPKTKEFFLLDACFQERSRPLIVRTIRIRGIQQDVHIDCETQGVSISSVAGVCLSKAM